MWATGLSPSGEPLKTVQFIPENLLPRDREVCVFFQTPIPHWMKVAYGGIKSSILPGCFALRHCS